jgi:hypothetical protein
VVRVPGHRSWGPGSVPCATRFFWKVMSLERGPLSLVSTIEELLVINSNDSGLENRDYGRRDPMRWRRDTLYPQSCALTSPTSCDRSVSIVRSLTKATEFSSLVNVTVLFPSEHWNTKLREREGERERERERETCGAQHQSLHLCRTVTKLLMWESPFSACQNEITLSWLELRCPKCILVTDQLKL